jgi:hypothetical protein
VYWSHTLQDKTTRGLHEITLRTFPDHRTRSSCRGTSLRVYFKLAAASMGSKFDCQWAHWQPGWRYRASPPTARTAEVLTLKRRRQAHSGHTAAPATGRALSVGNLHAVP